MSLVSITPDTVAPPLTSRTMQEDSNYWYRNNVLHIASFSYRLLRAGVKILVIFWSGGDYKIIL